MQTAKFCMLGSWFLLFSREQKCVGFPNVLNANSEYFITDQMFWFMVKGTMEASSWNSPTSDNS